jgi:hypothetical protein
MSRNSLRWAVRLILLGILGGLLAYVWMTDRPSPAYPAGEFLHLVVFALVVVVVAAAVAFIWRGMRR